MSIFKNSQGSDSFRTQIHKPSRISTIDENHPNHQLSCNWYRILYLWYDGYKRTSRGSKTNFGRQLLCWLFSIKSLTESQEWLLFFLLYIVNILRVSNIWSRKGICLQHGFWTSILMPQHTNLLPRLQMHICEFMLPGWHQTGTFCQREALSSKRWPFSTLHPKLHPHPPSAYSLTHIYIHTHKCRKTLMMPRVGDVWMRKRNHEVIIFLTWLRKRQLKLKGVEK